MDNFFLIFFLVKGFFYVSLLLGILKEVTGSSLMQRPDPDEEVATLFDMVQKVFQKLLECMARSFRKQPEEGLRVLTPFRDGLWGPQTGALGQHHLTCRLSSCSPVPLGGVCLRVGDSYPVPSLTSCSLTLRAWAGREVVLSAAGAGGPRAHP